METSQNYISEKVRNSDNIVINPATLEKQDEMITALSNISIDADSINLNTDWLETLQTVWNASLTSIDWKQSTVLVNQSTLIDLTQALYELIERLTFLTSVRWVAWDLRVTPLSTPNMATLTTLTNMASVWGYLANPQIPWMMNNTAIQSNITNISI